jgi:hypothetical protein
LTTEALHPKTLGITIATIARTSTTFFMSHTLSSLTLLIQMTKILL